MGGKTLEGVAHGHDAGPQPGVGGGVVLVEGGLDVVEDGAGLVVVAHLRRLLPEPLIQVDVPDLGHAGDIHPLAGAAGPAGGIPVAEAVRGHRHLGDALPGVTGGIPVDKVMTGDVQALLGGGETLLGGLEP